MVIFKLSLVRAREEREKRKGKKREKVFDEW